MSVASLLTGTDPVFDFEHAMAHRTPMAIMAPLTRFGLMPYFIEPAPLQAPALADMWSLKHQQAHGDFANFVPAFWNGGEFGIPTWGNLIDTRTPEGMAWWIFTNHIEHFLANDTMQPLPTEPPPAPPWFQRTGATYPFW